MIVIFKAVLLCLMCLLFFFWDPSLRHPKEVDEKLDSHFVQFDPAPRRGEAAISRPPVEYFL